MVSLVDWLYPKSINVVCGDSDRMKALGSVKYTKYDPKNNKDDTKY